MDLLHEYRHLLGTLTVISLNILLHEQMRSDSVGGPVGDSPTAVHGRRGSYPSAGQPPPHGEYDFIVVGAGSGGAIVASRLSEIPEFRVLLIEAGPRESIYTRTMAMWCQLPGTEYDWGYETEPIEGAGYALKGRRARWPAGRSIGGTSAINAANYVRGNPADFDYWAKVTRSPQWSYSKVLPYFMKTEDHQSPRRASNGFHGRGGPLYVNDPVDPLPISEDFVHACEEAGIRRAVDYNSDQQWGATTFQVNVKDGRKQSTGAAFLEPIADKRKNLDILTEAYVTRVLFDDHRRAKGVEYIVGESNKVQTVYAGREIILAAGAVGTPAILLRSGVGPADDLRSHGIPCVANLPGVGENVHEHYGLPLHFTVERPNATLDEGQVLNRRSLEDYAQNGRGPLTTNFIEAGAFLSFGPNGEILTHPPRHGHHWESIGVKSPGWPEVEFYFIVGKYGDQVNTNVGLSEEFVEQYLRPNSNKQQITIVVLLLHSKTRGQIKLRSADPLDKPLISYNYYSHPEDVETIVKAAKAGLAVAEMPSLRDKYGARPFLTEVPGCEKYRPRFSDAHLECMARVYARTLYHFAGSCRMGAHDDPLACTDPDLRVLGGVKGLRIADASVMPEVTSGNTNAPSMMIGEKAADLILHDHLHAAKAA